MRRMKPLATALLTGVVTVAGLVVPGLPGATAGKADHGRVWARDRALRDGCHHYGYHYRVRPPTSSWALETFLRDRRGRSVASDALLAPHDGKRGRSAFRLCRYNTVPGRFTIRAKLTWQDGWDSHATWIAPGRFRMHR
jgi:hypothetical protein